MGSVIDYERQYETYEELKNDALSCVRCDLCSTRQNVVFCDGLPSARVMIVGEAPGATEDEIGLPFVGRSGKLLVQLFSEIGIEREDLYIANVIKCRPPENRNPTLEEIRRCSAFLEHQIRFVNPKVIVPVGNFATRYVLQTKEGIKKIRGKPFEVGNSIVVPTVHPAYVLRNGKRGESEMREDLQVVKKILEG